MSEDFLPEGTPQLALAEALASVKRDVAAEVTQEFFRRHPEWLARYGAAGLERGFEDACYHMDFVAAAVETASTRLFENYARWTGRVLQSRGIAPDFVVENFAQIETALESRIGPSAFGPVRSVLRAGMDALLHPETATPSEKQVAGARQLFCTALLRGQRSAAVTIALEAIANGAPPAEVYLDLCARSLWDIGELWERNQITVADEHRATAIVQYVIGQIYAGVPLKAVDRGKLVVTGVEGEMHQLGANIVADLLEMEGWDVCFLGTNLPHGAILQKIADHQAGAVFISVTMPFNLTSVRRLIAAIRAQFGAGILIVVGGQAFAAAPSFFKYAGADAFAPTADEGAAIILRRSPLTVLPRAPRESAE